MATEAETHHACPDSDALRGLIRGEVPDADQAALTGHLGDCPGCQAKLERIASDGDPRLSDAVRHVDQTIPPRHSAYWRALESAEKSLSLTQSIATAETTRSGELKLDFLKPSDQPGSIGRIAHFEIRRLIGRGGMGAVFHAHDPCLNRDVAVKILDPQLANNEVAHQRFCREARAAASVSHDNLVSVFQVDELEGSNLPFLVMQLVNGETLEQRVKRVGKLSVAEAVRVGMQAAAGLAAAHAGGLIHRDIKPANMILEDGTDKVKLTDFGLARAAEDLKLTRTGFVAGTPLYMAPEQARGDDVDARADLFSLGSVLYEALSGVPPFDGKTPLAVLRRIADEKHVPIEKLNPQVPDWLADVVDKLLAKDPARRFQTAAEVAELLSAKHVCLEPTDAAPERCIIAQAKSKIIGRRQRRAVVAAMIGPLLLGGVVGGLGVWFLTGGRTDVVPSEVTRSGNGTGGPVEPAGPPPLATLRGMGGSVWSVATSKDGQRIALGMENGQILNFERLPDGRDWRREANIGRHAGPIWSLDFTPDGKRVVAASDDGSVKVWDVATRRSVMDLPHPSSVRAAALSHKTNYLVTGDRAGTVRVWDLDDGMPIRQFNHGAAVHGVAFAPDGLTVASAGSDHRVVVWEIPGPKGVERISLSQHKGPVYDLSFSPDGDWLASTGWDKSVILWDLKDGSVVKTIPDAHGDDVWSVSFACCGKVIATAGQDGAVKAWDAELGTLLGTFTGHKGAAHVARFTPDGSLLVTGGRDGNALVYAVERPEKK